MKLMTPENYYSRHARDPLTLSEFCIGMGMFCAALAVVLAGWWGWEQL